MKIDGLTSVNFGVIFDGFRLGFKTVTIQWMVSRFNNFAQVLFSGLVFEKIFSRKLNSLILTCGRRLTTEEMDG